VPYGKIILFDAGHTVLAGIAQGLIVEVQGDPHFSAP